MRTEKSRSWAPATAAERLEASLGRIAGGAPGTAHVFTETFAGEARRQVQHLGEVPDHPLKGALVTIKDLFDVEGHVTRAGSPALMERAPAAADAPCIARLRAAGAVFVGHTNMTELAYSGIGMNPYFGTPANTLFPGGVPGGSSSGGAVSVALGLADIAIGSDTGGSLRIPAAFNGIVGFKPTQASVPREGGVPLSTTLDSFGPMARSVAGCALAWSVMADVDAKPADAEMPELVVPANFGRDRLDAAVEAGFVATCELLSDKGLKIVEERLPSLDYYKEIPVWRIAAVEAHRDHGGLFAAHAPQMDRRVVQRIRRAEALAPGDYEATLEMRAEFVDRFAADLGSRMLFLPTVAILPPQISALEDDTVFGETNLLVLRNTTMGNYADSCSISLPFPAGDGMIGIMLTAIGGRDRELLSVATRLEGLLAI